MAEPEPIVETSEVATMLGVEVAALTPVQRKRIGMAIRSAQAKVCTYLKRDSLALVEHTLTGVRPRPGWALTDRRAWDYEQFDDKVTVVSYEVADADAGTYDVVLGVGLDGANTEPVRDWVLSDATEQVRNDPASGLGERQVTSVSAEGQSVSYASGSVAAGAAGSVPNLDTLKRFRRVPAYRRAESPQSVWPYRW